jgi:hypothetical protein
MTLTAEGDKGVPRRRGLFMGYQVKELFCKMDNGTLPNPLGFGQLGIQKFTMADGMCRLNATNNPEAFTACNYKSYLLAVRMDAAILLVVPGKVRQR